MGSVDVMAVDVTATVCAITGVRAAPTLAQPIWNTLADSACSYHINSLAPAVALPAPRHDRRRTGAAGSPPGGFPFFRGGRGLIWAKTVSPQGNRVKESCGDEACEEIIIPCGDFAFETEAVFAGGFSDEIEGDVLERGEIGGRMIGADATFVVAEDHVHHPV